MPNQNCYKKHFLCTTVGPPSSYSAFDICWFCGNTTFAKIAPPIQAEYAKVFSGIYSGGCKRSYGAIVSKCAVQYAEHITRKVNLRPTFTRVGRTDGGAAIIASR